jgi:hypothetical protein
MHALHQKLSTARPVRMRTLRDLLGGAGRLTLWLVVGLLLIRGIGTLGATDSARAPQPSRAVPVAVWPDDAARALAVEFATAYLTHTPGENPDAATQRLTALAAPDLAGDLAPQFDRDAPAQAVRSATVARTVTLDGQHALVTVAATLADGGQLDTRRLTVSVARDKSGGVVVDQLTSFASAPTRAALAPREAEPLIGADRGAIEAVLGRFLRAYIAGDTGGLAYLVAPGVRITAAADRLELRSLASFTVVGPAAGARRGVLATVLARDPQTRALYVLRYRVELVRRDRWYVAAINDRGRSR